MLKITLPYKKILSVNNYLMPVKKIKKVRTSRGIKSKEVIRNIKSPSARKQSSRIVKYIIDNYSDKIKELWSYNKNEKFFWVWKYSIHGISKKDLTNLKKIQEDSVVTAINKILDGDAYDDTQVYFDFSFKVESKIELQEQIDLSIYSLNEVNGEMIAEIIKDCCGK